MESTVGSSVGRSCGDITLGASAARHDDLLGATIGTGTHLRDGSVTRWTSVGVSRRKSKVAP